MSISAHKAPQKQGEGRDLSHLVKRLHTTNNVAVAVIWAVAFLVFAVFIAIVLYLLVQGFQVSSGSLPLLINPSFYGTSAASIGPEIFNTFYILILSEIFLFPIALGAAIYTVEYAPQGKLVSVIRFAAETLAGVPSIVLGLFGAILFVQVFHFQVSRLSGALTLLCLNFPLALRLFEDALVSVPREMREGSLALGCSKWHMIRTVVLPSALPGLITGLILSSGKIIGETAALVYTLGGVNPIGGNVFSLNPLLPSDNLTIRLWYLKTQDTPGNMTAVQATAIAAASATLLIVILLIINLSARAIGRAVQRRITAE